MQLGLPHPSITNIIWCVYTHPIDLMGIHLLRCVDGNECIGTHDVIHNTFAAIVWNASFHMGQKQLHALRSTTFNSFHQSVDIVFTKDDICTLANIVIVDPMQANLLPWSFATKGFEASNASQAKERNYCNQHPTYQFLPLAIEILGCLYKHADVFLHNCVNVIWSLKGPKGPHLYTLVTFFHQKVSITLQRMQVSSILSQAVAIGLATSRLPPVQDTPPITTTDLLQAIGFWHINMADLPQAVSYRHGEIFIATLSQLDVMSFLPFP
jgi:hypothetical protein